MRTNATVPQLDFGAWSVPFPQRGHYLFLPVDDLKNARSEPPSERESGVWLGRVESGVCVIIPIRLDVQREGVETILFGVLHEGDQIRLAGHDVRFREVRTINLRANARLVGELCIQCRTRLVRGARIVQCPLCLAPYCDDCWSYLINRRCYSRSCNYSPVEPASEPVARG